MTNSADIRISVVIPAYNIEGYIGRAVDSVLVQTCPPAEIIVVDDGSTDATAEKVKAYGDQVRYLFQSNKGLSGARNTGIQAARYNWIALLDGDDEWLPDYMERQIDILSAYPDLRWSAGNFFRCLCDEGRRAAATKPDKIRQLTKGKPFFESFFLASANGAAGCADTMVIHRDIFDAVGLFNEHQPFAEDLEMWWRISFRYPQVGYVAEPSAIYHMQRPGALTETFKTEKYQCLLRLLETNRLNAAEYGMSPEFAILVRFLVTSWIRGMLFENRPEDIRELLSKFGNALSRRFRLWVAVLLLWPKGSATILHFISKIVRKSGLRKKITRPPAPLK